MIRKAYLNFIEQKHRSFPGKLGYGFLCGLSGVYAMAVALRNFFYARGLLPSHAPTGKVISVGNISWGGSGKTTLVRYLHKQLSPSYAVASITKGYARDEFLLLQQALGNVFDAKDRPALIRKLASRFELFILDDGFQYRKIKRDADIVMMTPKEITSSRRLLPAYIFREPFSSLKRADIVIINYAHLAQDRHALISQLRLYNQALKVYFAQYRHAGFLDTNLRPVSGSILKDGRCALLTAIGYPEGFIKMVAASGISCARTITYPDHHEFGADTVRTIEKELKSQGIKNVIITRKDFYHIDFSVAQLNYFIFEVELSIDNEADFLCDIRRILERDARRLREVRLKNRKGAV